MSSPQPVAIQIDRPAIDAELGPAAEPVSELPDGAPPDEAAAGPVVPAPSPDAKPAVPDGRAAVLAAFKRNGTSPQPRPAVRQVERTPERQAEPPISREGWEELVSGYVAGNVNWNVKRLGAPPGDPNCRAPRDLLRSFGL